VTSHPPPGLTLIDWVLSKIIGLSPRQIFDLDKTILPDSQGASILEMHIQEPVGLVDYLANYAPGPAVAWLKPHDSLSV
jgi:hypothetical protein